MGKIYILFFFSSRRRHTRCGRDWSSDVCSSDLARTGRPLVIFKSAMTLDGKVASRTGDSQWISGEASRARAHRWRAESDAVAVGIGTALVDDPRLTARIEGVASQPRHVVFDSEARLPLDSKLVQGVAEVPLIVVCS